MNDRIRQLERTYSVGAGSFVVIPVRRRACSSRSDTDVRTKPRDRFVRRWPDDMIGDAAVDECERCDHVRGHADGRPFGTCVNGCPNSVAFVDMVRRRACPLGKHANLKG